MMKLVAGLVYSLVVLTLTYTGLGIEGWSGALVSLAQDEYHEHWSSSATGKVPQDDDGGGGGWDTRGKDGHYHNPNTGEVMDDQCNMRHDNAHPCHCDRTVPNKSNCDTLPSKRPATEPGSKCRTYCRKGDCHCHPDCGS